MLPPEPQVEPVRGHGMHANSRIPDDGEPRSHEPVGPYRNQGIGKALAVEVHRTQLTTELLFDVLVECAHGLGHEVVGPVGGHRDDDRRFVL